MKEARHLDLAFLHDEREYLEHGYAALRVMEREREHVAAEIERARTLAARAHIPLPEPGTRGRKLALIGVGNRYRRDDAAGLEVARRLRDAGPSKVEILEEEGEPASLIEAWAHADEALVIDGVSSNSSPGTLHRFEAHTAPLPAELFLPSTHALGVAEAVELARELDRLPRRLAVYGIEGEDFSVGEGLTAAVEATVGLLVAELFEELDGDGS